MKKITIIAEDNIAIEIAKSIVVLGGVHEFQMEAEQREPKTTIDLGPAPRRMNTIGKRGRKPEAGKKPDGEKREWSPSQAVKDAVMHSINQAHKPFKVNDISVEGFSSGSVEGVLRLYRKEGLIKRVGGDQSKGFLYDMAKA